MSIVRWSPTRELERIQDEINKLFDFDQPTNSMGLFDRSVSPALDVADEDDRYRIEIELPGVSEDAVDVSVANNVLTIGGEKQRAEVPENAKVFRRETWYGSFQRTLSLPRTVDADQISAQMKNGVLTLTLPKREEEKPRKIEVSLN
jgi:HSP20 family protein